MYDFVLLYPIKWYSFLFCVASVSVLTSETVAKESSHVRGLISGNIFE